MKVIILILKAASFSEMSVPTPPNYTPSHHRKHYPPQSPSCEFKISLLRGLHLRFSDLDGGVRCWTYGTVQNCLCVVDSVVMSGVAVDMMGWEKHLKHSGNYNSREIFQALPELALKSTVFWDVKPYIRIARKTVKSDYQLRLIRPSVCPHRTARLPLDGFQWNLIFEDFFSKNLSR